MCYVLIKREMDVTHSFNEVCVGLKKLGRVEDSPSASPMASIAPFIKPFLNTSVKPTIKQTSHLVLSPHSPPGLKDTRETVSCHVKKSRSFILRSPGVPEHQEMEAELVLMI